MTYDARKLLYESGGSFPQTQVSGYDETTQTFNTVKVDQFGHLSQDSYVWDTVGMAWVPAESIGSGTVAVVGVKNIAGTQVNPATEDTLSTLTNFYTASPFVGYVVCDLEEVTGGNSYYGYANSAGAWYIRRFNDTNGTMRFATGASNYTTAWTNRASQTYTLPS